MVEKKPHYAWAILGACCMIQCATLGIIQNSRGLFYEPVSSNIGCSITEFTLQQVFFSAAGIATLPLVDKFFQSKKLRWLLALLLLIFSGCSVLMAVFTEVWQWYIASAIQGASSSFLILMPSVYLINRWFDDCRGLAMGIASAAAGISGMAINALFAEYISSNWRNGYFLLGFMSLICSVPITIIFVRSKPAEKNCLPFKAKSPKKLQNKPKTYCVSDIKIKNSLGILLIVAGTVSFCSTYLQHFSNFSLSIGEPLAVGATMTSFAMLGNTFGKMSMGALSDKFGSFKTSTIYIVLITLSFAGMFLHSTVALYLSAVFNGFTLSFNSVCMPLLFNDVYGIDNAGRKTSIMLMLTTAASSIGTSVVSALYDYEGGYNTAFFAGISVMTLSLVSLLYLMAKIKFAKHVMN